MARNKTANAGYDGEFPPSFEIGFKRERRLEAVPYSRYEDAAGITVKVVIGLKKLTTGRGI